MNKSMPIVVWGMTYGDFIVRTFFHNDGLPENFGLFFKHELTKYPDIKVLRYAFDNVILIDPYKDKVENNELDYITKHNLVDFNRLFNKARKLGLKPSDDLKRNWFALLDQWTERGLEPYVKYELGFMIDYDSVYEQKELPPISFEYSVDLDSEDLIVIGMEETTIPLLELYNMSDKEFIDMIYENENETIFRGDPL